MAPNLDPLASNHEAFHRAKPRDARGARSGPLRRQSVNNPAARQHKLDRLVPRRNKSTQYRRLSAADGTRRPRRSQGNVFAVAKRLRLGRPHGSRWFGATAPTGQFWIAGRCVPVARVGHRCPSRGPVVRIARGLVVFDQSGLARPGRFQSEKTFRFCRKAAVDGPCAVRWCFAQTFWRAACNT